MTTYARLTQDKTAFEALVELSAEQFSALAAWKQSFLRLYVVDAPPTPSATQLVIEGAPLIDATTYHKTWTLRDKTQEELDADTQVVELAQLQNMIAALTADIQAGITAAPTTAAQAFVEIQDLKRRALRTDRAIRWLIKQQN